MSYAIDIPAGKERKIERTSRSAEFYRGVFGEFIAPGNVESILDVGAGDASFAEEVVPATGQRITRVDRDYADDPPTGQDWHVADARDLSEFYDTFDVTISAFMMQHMSPDEQAVALREMIRTTKVCHAGPDGYAGHVGICPVYKPDRLRKQLSEAGFYLSTAVVDNISQEDIILDRKKASIYSTLWIERDDGMTDDRAAELAEVVAGTGALSRRTTLRDLARRSLMPDGVSRRKV